jgi:hypothetical protein
MLLHQGGTAAGALVRAGAELHAGHHPADRAARDPILSGEGLAADVAPISSTLRGRAELSSERKFEIRPRGSAAGAQRFAWSQYRGRLHAHAGAGCCETRR